MTASNAFFEPQHSFATSAGIATGMPTWPRKRSSNSTLAIRISVEASKTIIMTKYYNRKCTTRLPKSRENSRTSIHCAGGESPRMLGLWWVHESQSLSISRQGARVFSSDLGDSRGPPACVSAAAPRQEHRSRRCCWPASHHSPGFRRLLYSLGDMRRRTQVEEGGGNVFAS